MTAPHIRCESGSVRHSYLGSVINPVELCLTSGATATLRIDTAPRAWARPSLAGAPSLRIVSTTSTARSTTIEIAAVGSGVARILAGPAPQWSLRVAVVA